MAWILYEWSTFQLICNPICPVFYCMILPLLHWLMPLEGATTISMEKGFKLRKRPVCQSVPTDPILWCHSSRGTDRGPRRRTLASSLSSCQPFQSGSGRSRPDARCSCRGFSWTETKVGWHFAIQNNDENQGYFLKGLFINNVMQVGWRGSHTFVTLCCLSKTGSLLWGVIKSTN